MRVSLITITTGIAVASFTWLTVQAQPVVYGQRLANQNAQGGLALRSAGAFNGSNVDAAGTRRLWSDGNGNVAAAGSSGFTTQSGSSGNRSGSFTRSADGIASGERSTTATNANTGVTFDASTSYTRGSGLSRSAGCKGSTGNAVTCGSAR